MTNIQVTNHSKQRTKDRVGISKKLCEKNAQKAMEYGITHKEAKGSLCKYMDSLYLQYKTANNIRIYNRFVYIFTNNILITILELPRNLYNVADAISKQKKESQKAS